MQNIHIFIYFFCIIFISSLFAKNGDDEPIITVPDSVKTHIESFEINVENGSRINLSNKTGIKFTLIDSIEAKFNHIVENDLKHFWQYIFNLRGGTIHISYSDTSSEKPNIHLQSSSTDLLIPKRNTLLKLNRMGMKLETSRSNNSISIKMDQHFDTLDVLDSLKGSDLVILSDVPVDPTLLSESLSDDMRIYMPQTIKTKTTELLIDSLKEEHCVRIVILLNRDDRIADTIMALCRKRINENEVLENSSVESDIFLGNIEDMVSEKLKETLIPNEYFLKENEIDSKVKDSIFVGDDKTSIKVPSKSGIELPGGLVFIKGGEFRMGSNDNIGNLDENPQHPVILNDFFMDETEVTVSEYNKVMKISSAESDRCPNCPVTNVNYYEAHHYCFNIGKRLPTEAEWEYAARAGTETLFYTGNKLGPNDANFDTRRAYGTQGITDYRQRALPVMSYKPNYWGLFDMIGNVGEWCDDWYSKNYYKVSETNNPKGPASGTYKVVRGGTWSSPGVGLRSSKRYGYNPNVRMETIGFRCVKDVINTIQKDDSKKTGNGEKKHGQ